MNTFEHRKDEYLEKLWVLGERGQDDVGAFSELLDEEFDPDLLAEMVEEGLVEVSGQGKRIAFTESGQLRARRVIRAHRIGERLLFHVFGSNFEKGACEFEHVVTVELVDGLCTLLGHPRKCPHGNSIPEGECCKKFEKTAHNAIIPLRDMEIGQSAKVAYVDCRDNRQLYKLNGFQIRPGVEVIMQQHKPCIVVDCEGASIALDETIASDVRVWAKNKALVNQALPIAGKRRFGGFGSFCRKFCWNKSSG